MASCAHLPLGPPPASYVWGTASCWAGCMKPPHITPFHLHPVLRKWVLRVPHVPGEETEAHQSRGHSTKGQRWGLGSGVCAPSCYSRERMQRSPEQPRARGVGAGPVLVVRVMAVLVWMWPRDLFPPPAPLPRLPCGSVPALHQITARAAPGRGWLCGLRGSSVQPCLAGQAQCPWKH